MKLLCVADESDPLVYSLNIAQRYSDVDVVIAAGDLPLSYYEYIVSMLNKPLYFVFGNHNLEDFHKYQNKNGLDGSMSRLRFEEEYSIFGTGSECIDGRVLRDGTTGLLLAGLGGSMRYNNGAHQFTERQMAFRIVKLLPKLLYHRIRYGKWLDILITHAPPRGYGDERDLCHTGFTVFLWFMRHFKPRFLLHGHVHLLDMNMPRVSRYESTEIINVYGSYVLERN